ncbi:baculoviral IAP repeat-containing protein 7-like [Ostrea edulis]|uniref:baculoviral IAP repeat-containing protein 7-like n=1 Tax=Ostrea edulis TaxID=37623 RepID=UPI0024AF8B8D|nr:baculoviral IAP repeat-containing protein 7-like [Ostrea edulis]
MSKYGSLQNPSVPSYGELSARLASFHTAPDILLNLLPNIAEAGFFYKGMDDHVRCFHCTLSLKHWEPGDDPWIEHAYWSPHCAYVLCNKSVKWVRQAFNAYARAKDSDRDWGDLPLDAAGNPMCTQKCHICLERDLRIAFLPCGHLCTCAMCASGLRTCPICRDAFVETVRIFTC